MLRLMAHTVQEKDKLILRIKRIRGQLNAAEKALQEEAECTELLHNLTACRAAMGSLIAELLEGHIHNHVLNPDRKINKEQLAAANELVAVIKTYLR